MEEGLVTKEQVLSIEDDFTNFLNERFKRTESYIPKVCRVIILFIE